MEWNRCAAGGSTTTIGAELYDPATGQWTLAGLVAGGRQNHTATLLANGQVLIAGGIDDSGPTGSAELFDADLGFSPSLQPRVTSIPTPIGLSDALAVNGSQFCGVSGGSGGYFQDSPANCPLVQLRGLESGQTTFLFVTNWSANSLVCPPPGNFPVGWAMATLFVNGVPGVGSLIDIPIPVPTPPVWIQASRLSDGSVQITFTNRPGALLGVLATPNLSLPLTNW